MKKVSVLLAAAMIAALILGAGADYLSGPQRDKEAAHAAAELIRSYGYPEDNPVIQAASSWWWEADDREKLDLAEQTSVDLMTEPVNPFPTEDDVGRDDPARRVTNEENAEIEGRNAEVGVPYNEEDTAVYYTAEMYDKYPVACEIWQYLRGEMGLSEAVSIGLIAGWMEESGGQTLYIDPYVATGSGYYCYYGIACWSVYYCPEIWGADLTGQLDYFAQTCKANMELFGGSYDYFCGLTDPAEVVAYYYQFYGRGYGWPSAQRVANCETVREFFDA